MCTVTQVTNIVPDALSRSCSHDLSSLTLTEPEIDLNSTHFLDQDYVTLKDKVLVDQSKYPDIKVIDEYVYIRTEPIEEKITKNKNVGNCGYHLNYV